MERFIAYAFIALGMVTARVMLEEFANSPTADNFVGLNSMIRIAFIVLSPMGWIAGIIISEITLSRRNA